MSDLKCMLCPRKCHVDRVDKYGFCNQGVNMRVAKVMLHKWEEPCISGDIKNNSHSGSGTIFFCGCNLQCRFCQNHEISFRKYGNPEPGIEVSPQELSSIFLNLQKSGAANINLVTATHFADKILTALQICKDRLNIPIIYNSGGYESVETIEMLQNYIDVWLPDLKFFSPEISRNYAKAPDYFEFASNSILKMYKSCGKYELNNHGLITKGVLIRHLTLPGSRLDSIDIIEWLSKNIPAKDILFSLMCQYTPYNNDSKYSVLNRRVSTFEYNSVLEAAQNAGFVGYSQERSSAQNIFTPIFSRGTDELKDFLQLNS